MEFLKEIEISVTNICNLRCRHCSVTNDDSRAIQELSLAEIEKILTEAKSLGASKLDITGGEPSLRKDIDQIIGSAKKFGFRVKLLSNGTLLDHSKLMELKNAGLDGLGVSLDGASASVYAKTRRTSENDFKRALFNIQLAIELGLSVKINTVVSKASLEEITEITKLAKQLGCYEHRICIFVPVGRGQYWQEQVLDPDTWLKFIQEKMIKLNPEPLKVYLAINSLPSDIKKQCPTECLLKNPARLQILYNGDIFPCPMFSFGNVPIGNIRKDSLIKIWADKNIWKKIEKQIPKICPVKNKDFVCPCRKIDLSALGSQL